jgi:hypothetical protein
MIFSDFSFVRHNGQSNQWQRELENDNNCSKAVQIKSLICWKREASF